jgi:hypothetical protein
MSAERGGKGCTSSGDEEGGPSKTLYFMVPAKRIRPTRATFQKRIKTAYEYNTRLLHIS